MKILHVTPHMGGGIGKAIYGLIQESNQDIHHDILLLEEPKDKKYLRTVEKSEVLFSANPNDYDIIQVEFFNNPLIPKFLCSQKFHGRFVFWCHISGLHTPIIPLFNRPNAFPWFETVLTSPCSSDKYPGCPVICSAGIPDDFPSRDASRGNSYHNLCYLGTLDRTKMHPGYIHIVSPITKYKSMALFIIGNGNDTDYYKECISKLSLTHHVHILGQHDYPEEFMKYMDFMVYLLNPYHYGTAENSLVEAMAMGIIPIVLGNPAELCIVKDRVTGLVMRDVSKGSFSDILNWIEANPDSVHRIRKNGIQVARTLYNYKASADQFEYLYSKVMEEPKKTFDFTQIFGNEPHNWFQSFQEFPGLYCVDENPISVYDRPNRVCRTGNNNLDAVMFAEGKGSVKNYAKYFPEDKLLQEWSTQL